VTLPTPEGGGFCRTHSPTAYVIRRPIITKSTHPHSTTPTVWAISDTHLSFARPRDQARFGEQWRNHTERLAAAWRERIAPQDIILMPGDLSWAHSPARVRPDIDWLSALPGRKVLVRGNHDFWWKRIEQIRREVLPPDIQAVQGSCIALDGLLICGTMGHIAPNDPYFRPEKLRSYRRERDWLRSSLEEARQMQTDGEPVLLMMHYPPYTSDGRPSGFTEIIQQFAPEVCVYGHLHFKEEWAVAIEGPQNGTTYHLVACDYLNMIPRCIWPPEDTTKKAATHAQQQNI